MGKAQPTNVLVFGILSSVTAKEDISIVLSHTACGRLFQQLEELTVDGKQEVNL
jgi:hypothetical protein